MTKQFDCVVCGSCTVDVLVRPVDLHMPIGVDQLHRVDPIRASVGGIVSNAGITMAKLGLQVAAFSAVGDDPWADLVRREYQRHGIGTRWLTTRKELPTSTTVVMIDGTGARSFVHSQGAPRLLSARDYLAASDLFSQSRCMLLGYYPLFPGMLGEVAEVFRAIRDTGCLTSLDSAGGGGTMDPLREILPHTDIYFPSFAEASAQTRLHEPREILQVYRKCGAPGVIGVKLGDRGALLSPAKGQFIEIEPVTPPGEVVDTTGAGDVFMGGLIAGLLQGMTPEDAGHLAAAAGAQSVTATGATAAAITLENLPKRDTH